MFLVQLLRRIGLEASGPEVALLRQLAVFINGSQPIHSTMSCMFPLQLLRRIGLEASGPEVALLRQLASS
jgi:hypothetical protein